MTLSNSLSVFTLQATEEEKSVYERSSSKTIYLNLSVHTLRRLREESAASADSSTGAMLSPTKNPHAVSHEAILGGPKACQTSFSVHRSANQSSPSAFSGNFSHVVCFHLAIIVNYCHLYGTFFTIVVAE